MNHFVQAFMGGIILSLATSLNLKFNGRITGMSGLTFRSVFMAFEEISTATIVSILLTGSLYFFMNARLGWFSVPDYRQTVEGLGWIGFVLGGLLVGFGTKMANGCTSGHGLCGIPRFSVRSWVAVPIFMITAIITANAIEYLTVGGGAKVLGGQQMNTLKDNKMRNWLGDNSTPLLSLPVRAIMNDILLVLLVALLAWVFVSSGSNLMGVAVGVAVGVLFGIGLIISGMSERSSIKNFLVISKAWDWGLLVVFCTGVLANIALFTWILEGNPVLSREFDIPTRKDIDWKLITGSAIFGVGWGVLGLCPGPLAVTLARFVPQVTFGAIPAMLLGQFVASKV